MCSVINPLQATGAIIAAPGTELAARIAAEASAAVAANVGPAPPAIVPSAVPPASAPNSGSAAPADDQPQIVADSDDDDEEEEEEEGEEKEELDLDEDSEQAATVTASLVPAPPVIAAPVLLPTTIPPPTPVPTTTVTSAGPHVANPTYRSRKNPINEEQRQFLLRHGISSQRQEISTETDVILGDERPAGLPEIDTFRPAAESVLSAGNGLPAMSQAWSDVNKEVEREFEGSFAREICR